MKIILCVIGLIVLNGCQKKEEVREVEQETNKQIIVAIEPNNMLIHTVYYDGVIQVAYIQVNDSTNCVIMAGSQRGGIDCDFRKGK